MTSIKQKFKRVDTERSHAKRQQIPLTNTDIRLKPNNLLKNRQQPLFATKSTKDTKKVR